jgi:excinuclease ABC subunit A
VRGGGTIVAGETPEHVAKVNASYTGKYLRDLLARRGVAAQEKRPAASGRLAERESEGATKKSKKLAAE